LSRKFIVFLLILIVALDLSSCVPEPKRYEAEFLQLFDTKTTIIGYSRSKSDFSEMAQLIYDNLKSYHELYDIYNDYDGINNIKTINDNAGISPVKVDRKIIDLLLFSKEAYELTNGKVNVAFGAVLRIWHDYRTAGIENPEQAAVPPMEELTAAVAHTDINKMVIDEESSTVYLKDPEMSLDVGAIAKGYATEMVARLAEENGFTNGSISVGGNVRTIGEKGGKLGKWNVGVQNPDRESEQTNLVLLSISDMSLVTSGNYERFYTVDGVRYHHIIDPVTLMPASYFNAVTILTPNSGYADALSTAVFNMPYDEGLALIESLEDAEALWVMPDGEVRCSSGFQAYIKST